MANTNDTVTKKKRSGILIIFLILIIAALAVTVVFLFRKNQENIDTISSMSEQAPAEKRNVVVNKDNVEEVINQLSEEEKTPAGNYEVVMSTLWNFANGSAVSNDAYIENAETNTNDVYFDVTLAETGETIYKSPVIPVGSYLKNVTLDTELAKGKYDSVITYSLLDEEQNVLSTVSVGFVINVKA